MGNIGERNTLSIIVPVYNIDRGIAVPRNRFGKGRK